MKNIPLQIRKNSWWTSGGSASKRTFVIAELYHDFDNAGVTEYHCVGLLEFPFDYPIYVDIEEFVRLFEGNELVPVNTLPILPKGYEKPPQPDFSKYLPASQIARR